MARETWAADRPRTPGGGKTFHDDTLMAHDQLTDDLRQRARLAVAGRARDAGDCRHLLLALGLVVEAAK